MTDATAPRRFGRPPTYPLAGMAVGDTVTMDVPTSADVKRIARNVSQHGQRHDRAYRCKTSRSTRTMTITRIR